MTLNEAYEAYQNKQTPDNYELFGEALMKFIKATVLIKFGTRQPDFIDDTCGEIILHVFEKLPLYRKDKAQFSTWVYMLAVHKGIDGIRREGRNPTTPFTGLESDEPELEWINKVALLKLQKGLTVPENRLVDLKLQGLEQGEIARELGVEEETVKKRWTRLQERLRTLVGGNQAKGA